MEGADEFGLLFGSEIDEQVSATDQVHSDERRMGDDVLHRKDDQFANRLLDPPRSAFGREPARPTLAGEACHLGFGIDAGASDFQRSLVDVAGEDMNVVIAEALAGLRQENGNR